MYLNFRISGFPYTLQHAGSGIGKSPRRPTLSGAVSLGPILWFGPGGAILPSRPRRYERQRAQRRSMMEARQRPTEGLSLTDASKMASSLGTGRAAGR